MSRGKLKLRPPGKGRLKEVRLTGQMGWLVLLSGLLVVVFAPQVRGMAGHIRADINSVQQSSAYNALINELVLSRGWLEVVRGSGTEPDIIRESAAYAPVTDRRWRDFVRKSYLRNDLKDPALWLVDASRRDLRIVQIDPTAHQVQGPYGGSDQWTGNIQFRPGSRATMTLRRMSAAGPTYDFSAFRGQDRAHQRRKGLVRLDEDGPAADGPYRTYVITDGSPADVGLATIMPIDDQSALVRVTPSARFDVSVGRVAVDRTAGQIGYYRLDVGQVLSIRSAGRTVNFIYEKSHLAVSRYDSLQRSRHEHRGLETFATGLEAAVQDPLNRDLVTTLDAGLQDAARNTLARKVGEAPGYRAAVAILDTQNGEVLALASLPGPAAVSKGQGTRVTDRLTSRNHNFDLLPIGSVAKVPFTLAILDTYPELVSLRVMPGAPGFNSLLGVDLEKHPDREFAIRDTVGGAEPVDLTQFLARSSNKYATALMLLAMAEEPAVADGLRVEGDCYLIGTQSRCRLPTLPILSARPQRGEYGHLPTLSLADRLRWPSVLAEFFGSEQGLTTEYLDSTAAPGVALWSGQGADRISPDTISRTLGLERENLGLNVIDGLRSDYLMSILGGGRSRWSTIRMAEVFSRIVTKQNIDARLLIGPARTEDPLTMDASAWSGVMQGMRAVVTSGTGSPLRPSMPAAPPGEEYRIFAKTGTPNVDRPTVGAADQVLVRLADYRCGLAWQDTGLTLAGEPPTSAGVARARGRVKQVCRDLMRTVSDFALASAMKDVTRSRIQGRTRTDGSILVDEIYADFAFIEGRGHAIALVIGRYAVGSRDDQPLRALTIVVNIQDTTSLGQAPATQVAAWLLEDPYIRAWLRHTPAPPQGAG